MKSKTEAQSTPVGTGFQVEANGISFRCRIDGAEQAPWLIFSNSLATNLSMWDGQVAVFGRSYRILRYDQRGHGGTSVPGEGCTFDQLADDVVALLDALRIERATFVGISMGAITALRLAARYASRMARIVACDGQWASPAGSAELWEERIKVAGSQGMDALVEPTVQRWFRPAFLAANPPVLGKVRQMIATTPAGGYIACSKALEKFDFRESLRESSVPTLFVVGALDGTMPQAMREMHQALAGSQFREIAEAGHLPNIEQAEEFNRILAGYLG